MCSAMRLSFSSFLLRVQAVVTKHRAMVFFLNLLLSPNTTSRKRSIGHAFLFFGFVVWSQPRCFSKAEPQGTCFTSSASKYQHHRQFSDSWKGNCLYFSGFSHFCFSSSLVKLNRIFIFSSHHYFLVLLKANI